MTIRKLRAGRVPGADANTWTGEAGTIFYDENTGVLRISDGNTPGGYAIPALAAAQVSLTTPTYPTHFPKTPHTITNPFPQNSSKTDAPGLFLFCHNMIFLFQS